MTKNRRIPTPSSAWFPLLEVVAETAGVGPATKRVAKQYDQLLDKLGAELPILNDIPLEEIPESFRFPADPRGSRTYAQG